MDAKIKVVGVVVEDMTPEDLRKAKKGLKKARLYFAPEGEVPGAKRPKVLFRQVFDEVFEKAGIARPEVITWDPLAGNALEPTDPGFVLDGVFNKNIRVTYAAAEEAPVEEPKVTEEASAEELHDNDSDEEVVLKSVLEQANGNQTAAAKILSVSRSTLARRLKKFAINAADFVKEVSAS